MKFQSVTPLIHRRITALGLGSLAITISALAMTLLGGGDSHDGLRSISNWGLANVIESIGGNPYGWHAFSLVNAAVCGFTIWMYIQQDRWSRTVRRIAFAAALVGMAALPLWINSLADFFGKATRSHYSYFSAVSEATNPPVVLLITALVLAPLLYLVGMPALRAHNRFLANPAPGFQRAEYRHWLTTLHPRRGVFDPAWRRALTSYRVYRAALRTLGRWACARHLAVSQRASSAVAIQRFDAWRTIAPIVLARHPNAAALITCDDVVMIIAAMREVIASSDGFGPGALRALEKAERDDPFTITRDTINVLGVIAGMGLMDQCLNGYSPQEAEGIARLNADVSWPPVGSPS